MSNDLVSEDPNLSFSPFAATDIKETWAYLAERGENSAEKFIRSVVKTCGMIAQNSLLGRDRSDMILGLRQFPFKNYNIFYFPVENGIEIYRILHSSRDQVQVFDDAIDGSI